MKPRDVKLPYLHSYRDRHGKIRAAYRRVEHRGGPRISVPIKGEVGSPGWLKHYREIHAGFEGEKKKKLKSPDTFSDIIPRWLASLEGKSENTRTQYRNIAKRLETIIGDQKIDSYRVRNVYALQDMIAETKSPATAERFITILSLIFKFARKRGLVETNPAEKIEPPAGYKPEPFRPWTDDEIQLVLNKAPDHIVRCVMVLLCTGLRVSDAVRLQWNKHVIDGHIEIDTVKTGTPVSVPVSSDLESELSKPRRGMFLLLSETGRTYKPGRCSTDIRTHMRRLGMEDTPPIHGLRKNAVMQLLEDGNDEEIIHAITGQSHEMIRHYGKAYQRRKRSAQVVVKPRFGEK